MVICKYSGIVIFSISGQALPSLANLTSERIIEILEDIFDFFLVVNLI